MHRSKTALVAAASLLALGAPSLASSPHAGSAATTSPPWRYETSTRRHADGARYVAHVVRVDLCAPGVELRATAPDEGPRTVGAWARRVGVDLAINGDFFDTPRGFTHAMPLGPARGHGVDWPARREYFFGAALAMRAGAPPDVVEGFPHDPRWTDVVATQERVVLDGEVHLDPHVVHARERHPRSAVGLSRDRRTLILVVVDGGSGRSSGATTPELGALLRELGAWDGLRMDGGGSSALFVAGRGVVNHPSDGHERTVANHLGVRVRRDAGAAVAAYCRDPMP